jgi:putative flippase GtrA
MNNIKELIIQHQKVVRYLFVGGSLAVFELLLTLLIKYSGAFYLYAAISASFTTFVLRFLIHKYYSFKHAELRKIHFEVLKYGVLCLISLALNTVFLSFFVEVLGLWYLLGQALSIGIISVLSYFFYTKIIFIKETKAV